MNFSPPRMIATPVGLRPPSVTIMRGKTQTWQDSPYHWRKTVLTSGTCSLSWPDKTLVYREEERITSAAQIALFEDVLARHPTASAICFVIDTPDTIIPRN